MALPRARERLRAAGQALLMGRWGAAHYAVSGGPMIMTSHAKTLLSSFSPAEKPSTGCFASSAHQPQFGGKPDLVRSRGVLRSPKRAQKKILQTSEKAERIWN